MGGATLPRRAVKAFRSAGATEEMIASARLIFGSLAREPPGRPRIYKNAKEADHAFYILIELVLDLVLRQSSLLAAARPPAGRFEQGLASVTRRRACCGSHWAPWWPS
jgi:hypothetical protein